VLLYGLSSLLTKKIFYMEKKFFYNSYCFLRRYFNIPKSRKLSWCIIKETTRSGTELRLGASVVGTNKYIDIARRRFFSEISLGGVQRVVYPAKRMSQGEDFVFQSLQDSCRITKSKGYIEDIYNISWFSPELIKKTLL
jgi:hypothetical protein